MEKMKRTKEPLTMDVFEKAMASIARSFSGVDTKFETIDKRFEAQQKILDGHTKALEIIVKELGNLREDNKYIRSTISSFVRDVSFHDRKIENLLTRVEKLEEQVFA